MTISRPLVLSHGQSEQLRAAAALLRTAHRSTFLGIVRRSLTRLDHAPSDAEAAIGVVPVMTHATLFDGALNRQQTNIENRQMIRDEDDDKIITRDGRHMCGCRRVTWCETARLCFGVR